MDMQDFSTAKKDMRSKGLDLQVVYHSHPHDPARPSVTDIKIATDYEDWTRRRVDAPENTLVAVLAAFGVAATTDAERNAALIAHDRAYWSRSLPPTIVVRAGARSSCWVHVTHGQPAEVWLALEDGTVRTGIRQVDNFTAPFPGNSIETQIARVMRRNAFTREEVLAIIARQATREARQAAADDIIVNEEGPLEQLATDVRQLHRHYLTLAGKGLA